MRERSFGSTARSPSRRRRIRAVHRSGPDAMKLAYALLELAAQMTPEECEVDPDE